jgi:hypothetical protein
MTYQAAFRMQPFRGFVVADLENPAGFAAKTGASS